MSLSRGRMTNLILNQSDTMECLYRKLYRDGVFFQIPWLEVEPISKLKRAEFRSTMESYYVSVSKVSQAIFVTRFQCFI